MSAVAKAAFNHRKSPLIIHAPTISEEQDGICVSAKVDIDRPDIQVPDEVWYRFPLHYTDYVTDRVDGFVIGLLPSAMALSEDIKVEAPISPRLAYGLREYQRIQNAWWPDEFKLVDVEYRAFREPGIPNNTAVGSSFSGGVDSFYTLWQHLERNEQLPAARITHCLMINGFDKDSDLNLTGKFQRTFDTYVPMMKDLGVEFLRSRGNLQLFRRATIKAEKLTHSHAAPLTASAMVLGNLLGRFYVPGALSYDCLEPEGSHPVTDHLFSTESLDIVHDGADATRAEKIEAIAAWPETHTRLRVCFKKPKFNPESGMLENCCECTKCVGTMIVLDLLGALPLYRTFPRPLERSQIWRAKMRPMRYRDYMQLAHGKGRRDRVIDLRFWSLRQSDMMTKTSRSLPEQTAPDVEKVQSDVPLYSKLIKRRFREWYIQDHPGIHSKYECKDGLRHHTDSNELWHCCPFWQRKLSNKLNAREFAIKCGVPVPKLYWFGKDPADIPFDELPTDYVVKTSTGWSGNEVLPLKGGRNVWDDKIWTPERVIETYSEKMSRKPFCRGYVFVEELMQADSVETLRECKCHVFDGRAGVISIANRSSMTAVRFTRDGRPIHERMGAVYAPGDPEELPTQFDEIIACAEGLGREYGHTFVRVDFHLTSTGVVFGEFTSTPARGVGYTLFADRKFGKMCAAMQADAPPEA